MFFFFKGKQKYYLSSYENFRQCIKLEFVKDKNVSQVNSKLRGTVISYISYKTNVKDC